MISPFTLTATSLFVILLALILVPLLSRNQRLLIVSVFSLTAVASLLTLTAGIWTVRDGITESYIIL